MQALSARTPSYFTNKSLQAYQHATAAGESSLSSISSSPQLSVFSVAPECHPDHRNSPLDIQIPALSFSPSRACCLFLAPQTTSHPSACFLHFLLICHFSLLFHSPCRPHHWLLLPELLTPQSCLPLNSLLSTIPCSTSPAASTLHALPQPLFLTSHCLILSFLDPLWFQRPH